MNYVKRIFYYLKFYKKTSAWVLFFSLLYAVFSIVSVGTLIPILGILFDRQKHIQPVAPDALSPSFEGLKQALYYYITQAIDAFGAVTTLSFICFFASFLFLLRNLFRYLSSYFFSGMRSGIAKKLRDNLHKKILALPIGYFTNQRKGDIITRFSADINEVEWTILSAFVNIFVSPITILLHLVALFYINYKLTLFAFILLPIAGFIISKIAKGLKKDANNAQNMVGQLVSETEESLNGLKIIKIFNASRIRQTLFENTSKQNDRFSRKVYRKKDLSSPMSEFLGASTILALTWYGGSIILEQGQGFAAEDFLGYIALFFQMIEPIKTFNTTFYDLQKGSASAKRIFELLDAPITIKDKPNARIITSFSNQITFKNISFHYEDGKEVFHDFSLEIKKGQRVALVGPSGSGKSTLAQLLTRFYDVTSGQISIDDIDIRDIQLTSYSSLFGLVTQESILFNNTVFNNIGLGATSAKISDVEKAAHISYADEFINKLPKRYQTLIGDNGSKLSGGQKQRLCIARAVIKNPPIMVLDEATSALDTQSEQWVQKALENMMRDRTSLIIAHRLSTIKNVDTIIVLDKGKIVEQGNHKSLFARETGVYKRLVEMQSFS